jgi:hypothetical protein
MACWQYKENTEGEMMRLFNLAKADKRLKAYAKGYERGAKEMQEHLREMIIYNILNDAVLSTCMGTETIEKIVKIVEES